MNQNYYRAIILACTVFLIGCGNRVTDSQMQVAIQETEIVDAEEETDYVENVEADEKEDTESLEPEQADNSEINDAIIDESIQEVLAAYQDYIDENIGIAELDEYTDGKIYSMIYLDDDDIPECCYYGEYSLTALLWYKDGQVLSALSENSDYYYQERKGRFCRIGLHGSHEQHEFFEISDDADGFTQTGFADICHVTDDGYPNYNIGMDSIDNDGEEGVDEMEYENYINSFGVYSDMPEMSASLEEAYMDLLAREAEESP